MSDWTPGVWQAAKACAKMADNGYTAQDFSLVIARNLREHAPQDPAAPAAEALAEALETAVSKCHECSGNGIRPVAKTLPKTGGQYMQGENCPVCEPLRKALADWKER